MMYDVLDRLREIAAFMVLCEVLLHLFAADKYMKFMKPLIGILIVVKILTVSRTWNPDLMGRRFAQLEQQLQDFNLQGDNDLEIDFQMDSQEDPNTQYNKLKEDLIINDLPTVFIESEPIEVVIHE